MLLRRSFRASMPLAQIGQTTHPGKKCGLRLVIANKDEKLEVLDARRTTLLRELDRKNEKITQTRVELDKAKSLL
jgi:hypothetical protein